MSYSSEVLADSPLMYWRMDSGGTDSSGNSRTADAGVNGTSVSGLLAGDPTSTAVQFNGSSQYLQRSYGSWMAVSSFTVECWVKTTATAQQYLVARDNQPTDRIWALGHSLSGSAGKPYVVRLKNPGGTITAEVAQGTTSINDGNPHHLVGTYDGTNLKLYVDGSLQATTAASGGLYVAGVWIDVASNAGSLLFYNGTLDEVAFYGTALSSTRVSAHYAAGTTTSGAATGTGSLSLSGSGTASGPVTGTGSLSLSGSGAAKGAATGSGSLTLSATGDTVPPSTATGTGSLSLSGSGAAGIGRTGTGSLTLSGTGAAVGSSAATGTGSLTLSGSGSATLADSGTGFLTLAATGTAQVLYVTDTSNLLNGRVRRASATATVERPPAATPTRAAVKYDKAVPYPPPTLVDGRVV